MSFLQFTGKSPDGGAGSLWPNKFLTVLREESRLRLRELVAQCVSYSSQGRVQIAPQGACGPMSFFQFSGKSPDCALGSLWPNEFLIVFREESRWRCREIVA